MLIASHYVWKPRERLWKTATHSKVWMYAMAVNCMWKIWDRKLDGKLYFWLNTLAHWLCICWSINVHGSSMAMFRRPRTTRPHSKLLFAAKMQRKWKSINFAFISQQHCGSLLVHSLRQTTLRNGVRPSILAFNNANNEFVQKLRILLGIHCICFLSR